MASDRSEIDPKRHFRVVEPARPNAEPGGESASAAGNPLIKDWELQLNTGPRKFIAILIIVCFSGVLIYRTWWLFLAAWITRDHPNDPAIYERAIRYDPNNADYHFTLAEIYNDSTGFINPHRAGEEYETAARLNPWRSAHWSEMSKYYEAAGNIERARYAMSRALEDDPNAAFEHWSAGQLYVRLGDMNAANLELRRTADLDTTYAPQVIDLVWQLYHDPDVIMSTDVPNTHDADLVALNYFIAQKSAHGTELAWDRLKAFETKPQERFPYVNYLLANNQFHPAWDVFAAGLASPYSSSAPPFYNPSFESETLNGGFDWIVSSSDDAEVRRDTSTVKDGLASLLVSFSGKQNVDYAQVYHLLPVDKGGAYTLKFWMKTDDISTNEGMFVDVDGQDSPKQSGTTYWQELAIPFTATSDVVHVTLRRVPSKKFDNLLKGKVWLDGFSITPQQGALRD